MRDKKFAYTIKTKEGNVYYRWPQWFQEQPDGSLVMCKTMPDDLSDFICRAGLGAPNPQIIRPGDDERRV